MRGLAYIAWFHSYHRARHAEQLARAAGRYERAVKLQQYGDDLWAEAVASGWEKPL